MIIALALEGLSSGSSNGEVSGCECALGPPTKAETAYGSTDLAPLQHCLLGSDFSFRNISRNAVQVSSAGICPSITPLV